jgi:hypothetical protein
MESDQTTEEERQIRLNFCNLCEDNLLIDKIYQTCNLCACPIEFVIRFKFKECLKGNWI